MQKKSKEQAIQSLLSMSIDNDSESVSENEADTDIEELSEPSAKKQRRLHRKSKEPPTYSYQKTFSLILQ